MFITECDDITWCHDLKHTLPFKIKIIKNMTSSMLLPLSLYRFANDSTFFSPLLSVSNLKIYFFNYCKNLIFIINKETLVRHIEKNLDDYENKKQ